MNNVIQHPHVSPCLRPHKADAQRHRLHVAMMFGCSLLAVVATLIRPTTGNAASFQGLGVLPLPSTILQSGARGISFDGAAVVGTVETNTDPVAFLWTTGAGVMTEVGFISQRFPTSEAFGVSEGGNFVVGHAGSESGQQEAYYRPNAGPLIGMDDLDGGQFASSATGISAGGQVIVGTGHSNFGGEAFRFDNLAGPLQGLGFLPDGISSEAHGVSADGGTIVGRSVTFSAISGEAFRWTPLAGMVGLGDLDGGQTESVAYAASAAGSVVVGAGTTSAGAEAFRWTSGGGMISLGDLPGGPVRSAARAVSALGTTIVGEAHSEAANSIAFLWDRENGMRDLRSVLVSQFGLASELAGWDLLSATGVSGDGRVLAGTGINPSGDFEAWRAVMGDTTLVSGETITEPIQLGYADTLQGFGTVTEVVAAPGSKIWATGGDLTIGDPTQSGAGYYDIFTGSSNVFIDGSRVTMLDSSVIFLGDPATGMPGSLTVNGLLTVNGSVVGTGKVTVSDYNFETPSIGGDANEIAGNSLAEPLTLSSNGGVIDISGWDGTIRNVIFEDAITTLMVDGMIGPGVKSMGDVTYQTTNTLKVEIVGTRAGDQFGQLDHHLDGGTARLGGAIDLQFVGGYVPAAGDRFEIIKATGGLLGVFDDEVLPVVSGLELELVYSRNSVILEVFLPGDFDFDGDVDGYDLIEWQRGNSADPLSSLDLMEWETGFGTNSANLTAQYSLVPEPTTAILLILALVGASLGHNLVYERVRRLNERHTP